MQKRGLKINDTPIHAMARRFIFCIAAGGAPQATTKAAICTSGAAAIANTTAAIAMKAVIRTGEGRVVVIGLLQGLNHFDAAYIAPPWVIINEQNDLCSIFL
jgi:hypothetical protein